MGIYLNPGANRFREMLRSEIYVDKSGMLSYLNKFFATEQKYVCISRPRRFGKSMAANMISAYYDRSTDAKELFQGMDIAQQDDFARYANQQDVLFINMQEFLSETKSIDELLLMLRKSLLWDLLEEYPDFHYFDETNLTRTMKNIFKKEIIIYL